MRPESADGKRAEGRSIEKAESRPDLSAFSVFSDFSLPSYMVLLATSSSTLMISGLAGVPATTKV